MHAVIDWNSVPVFGTRTRGERCVLRPGAYGLLADASRRIALVRTPKGVFLPGGGIEGAESVESALRREFLEECGFSVRVLSWSAHSVQFVLSESEDTEFEKRCTFREAVLEPGSAQRIELDHESFWSPPREAIALLSHASQRWAVERWCEHAAIRL
jgi:8-oxo-dGTP diphosphatase